MDLAMKTIKPDEINWTIAEILEPRDSIRLTFQGWSPLKVWFGMGVAANRKEIAIDFEHDPRGTVLLQSWLHGHYSYFAACWNGSAVEFEASGRNEKENYAVTYPLISDGLAWCRVFLRAHQVEVSE